MMSFKEDRLHSGHQTAAICDSTSPTPASVSSFGSQSPAPMSSRTVPMVVSTSATSSGHNATVITTTISTGTSTMNPSKKHNIGYRLRRLFFGPTTSGTPLSKPKVVKDVEAGENKTFIKHTSSLHSTSSAESSDNRSSSKRRRTRHQSAQTDSGTASAPISGLLPPLSTPSLSPVSSSSHGLLECSICLLEQPVSQYPELSTCQHRACLSCLRQYLRIEIYESRVNITCLECSELLHPNDIKTILRNNNALMEKYELFMVRRTLITDPDARWCPAPDCDYCVIASGCASCPMLKCERPGCETLFCYHCKQEWHPNQTCDQARAQRGFNRPVFVNAGNQTKSGVTFSSRGTDTFSQAHASTSMDSFVKRDDIKPCPCCKVLIIKMDDGSCNHMTCSVCGTEFCWLCMQKISDLHYLSPSGCTFWGKKPWSRKKKIMWQLGMLVGAPVGIALIAGIAVPAIIIGIPVWVGRKLYARFERNNLSRHKSNLLVTTGVLTSIFVSPILAAVAVGIGVPILLAYVYGVVPISLCRSGGCGVTTSSSGVRIELDEDEISATVAPDGVSVDTALSRGIANPSIGEVSLGMSTSLSIGSSSHLDRVVLDIQPDRESSSIAACAGSISSNTITGPNQAISTHTSNRLETQADINSHKRYSFSSQNADATSVTLSLGERSLNTNSSMLDDASLKVHTGSIRDCPPSGSTMEGHYSLSPVEVHVNINNGESVETSRSESSRSNTSHLDEHATHADLTHHSQSSSVNIILNKFESRSLEYIASNYCNICYKSHKPCCPNFQRPIKITKITPINSNSTASEEHHASSSAASGDDTHSGCGPSNQIESLPRTDHSLQVRSSTLPKKAMSQIFYPSQCQSESSSSERAKSGLTHSLSFTLAHQQ